MFVLALIAALALSLVAVTVHQRTNRIPALVLDDHAPQLSKEQLRAIGSIYERAITEGAAYLQTKSIAQLLLREDEPVWHDQVSPIIEDCEQAIEYLTGLLDQTRWLSYDRQSFLAQTITMLSMLIRGHEQILRAVQYRSSADLEGSPDMDTISQLTARIHKAKSYV